MGDSLGFWHLVSHILVSSLRPEPYTLCLSGEHCLLYAPIEILIDSGTPIAVVMIKSGVCLRLPGKFYQHLTIKPARGRG
jgi:hypothetical protein